MLAHQVQEIFDLSRESIIPDLRNARSVIESGNLKRDEISSAYFNFLSLVVDARLLSFLHEEMYGGWETQELAKGQYDLAIRNHDRAKTAFSSYPHSINDSAATLNRFIIITPIGFELWRMKSALTKCELEVPMEWTVTPDSQHLLIEDIQPIQGAIQAWMKLSLSLERIYLSELKKKHRVPGSNVLTAKTSQEDLKRPVFRNEKGSILQVLFDLLGNK